MIAGSISLVGAGLDAHLAYLTVMRDTTTIGPSDLSVPGIVRTIGFPSEVTDRLSLVIDVAGVVAVVLLRRRPDRAYRAAILTMVLGSPVVFVNTFLLLLPLIAPSLWPLNDRGDRSASPRKALIDASPA
ncbi:MAG: hypothetical protein ACYDCI_15610 [Candidatus Limnocylindrales bacterium]